MTDLNKSALNEMDGITPPEITSANSIDKSMLVCFTFLVCFTLF